MVILFTLLCCAQCVGFTLMCFTLHCTLLYLCLSFLDNQTTTSLVISKSYCILMYSPWQSCKLKFYTSCSSCCSDYVSMFDFFHNYYLYIYDSQILLELCAQILFCLLCSCWCLHIWKFMAQQWSWCQINHSKLSGIWLFILV